LKCSVHRESAGRNIGWKTTRGSSPKSKPSVKNLRWLINGMLPSFSSTTPIIHKREVKWSQNQIPLPRQGTVAGRRSAGNETNWLWNPSMGLRSISYISVPCVGFDATLRFCFWDPSLTYQYRAWVLMYFTLRFCFWDPSLTYQYRAWVLMYFKILFGSAVEPVFD
jgi:hypothetical protein